MKRLSSGATFYFKRVFPFGFFGLLFLFAATTAFLGYSKSQSPPLPFFIAPVVMAAFAYFIFKKLVFDLADEVLDLGDELLVRNSGKQDRIKLADISNISYSTAVNPQRVTLSLRKPSVFGTEVSFCPPIRFIPFAKSPIIEQLIARVDAERRIAT